jgi:hypothetical protein
LRLLVYFAAQRQSLVMRQIQDDDEENEGRPWWITIVSILLHLGVGSFFAYGYHNAKTFKDLGTWGDFVGGVLNPILTFLTVIGQNMQRHRH